MVKSLFFVYYFNFFLILFHVECCLCIFLGSGGGYRAMVDDFFFVGSDEDLGL